MIILRRFLAVLVVLVVGDALWLSFFAHAVFRPALGAILLDEPRWAAVALFYPLYALSTVYLAVTAAINWRAAAFKGAVFGFMAYATYDLTNLATIKAWTVSLAAMDIAWGTVLTTLAALAGFLAGRRR